MKVLISPNKPQRSGLKPACLGRSKCGCTSFASARNLTAAGEQRQSLNEQWPFTPNTAAADCRFGRLDYSYERESLVLPKDPPPQVQLGENCRAILCGWQLHRGVKLESVTLEILSPDVVIGLMGASLMNPDRL